MAKKLNTLLILGATIGAAAAGAYFYFKKQDAAYFDDEDTDDDFDFFEEEPESKKRNYVQLNPNSDTASDTLEAPKEAEQPAATEEKASDDQDAVV